MMNIHNNKNEILELTIKNQSEKQSCKLNELESKSNITLKKIGQKLDLAETKCFTLKSELSYMIGVCRKAQTEIKGSKGSSDTCKSLTVLQKPIISPHKNLILKSPVEHHDYNNEITATNKIPSHNILDRICNIEQNAEENFDAFRLSPKSDQFSPRKSIDNFIEKAESVREQGLLNVKITPRAHLDKQLPPAVTTMPVPNEITEANEGEYDNSRISCLPEYMREHLQQLLNVEGSIEELTSKTDEDYFRSMPDIVKKDIRDLEFDISDTAKIRRTEKNKRASRVERSEIHSFCKADDTISKTRKKRGKRGSASKSTIATKDTYFVCRKETKRRRHRTQIFNADQGVFHQKPTLSKHLKKSNDVVEIFHNATLKDSNSVMSSKHSKLGKQAKYVKKQLIQPAAQKIQEKSIDVKHDMKHEYRTHDQENQQIKNSPLQTLNYQSNTETTPENVQEKIESEKPSTDLYPPIQRKALQCEHTVLNRYDDPMFTRNYEMPTLASKLKRASRSYFSRFNFQNIPFVVGTSVTPSHNLGMNIQQVLSVMKTSQSITNDITPLIRKVSRGMKPISILLEQINGHCEKSVSDASSQMAEMLNSRKNPSVNQDNKLSPDLRHMGKDTHMPNVSGNPSKIIISGKDNSSLKQLCKEKGDSYDDEIKKQSFTFLNKGTKPSDAKSQQQNFGMSFHKKDNISNQRIPGSHNSKEIRDILINLHDQFEEMNTKYEKLQSEVGKTDDKSLARELSTLEKELNVKEEEINAVIGLYKEVMTLKQQIKMLHDKNSLVCIATESVKGSRKNSLPISIVPGTSYSNPTQILARQRIYGAMREPSTSMQLAALLRQIQTFHKQLQLVS